MELGFRNLQEKLEKCTYSEERDSLAVSTLGKVLAKHFINWYRFLDTALVFFVRNPQTEIALLFLSEFDVFVHFIECVLFGAIAQIFWRSVEY